MDGGSGKLSDSWQKIGPRQSGGKVSEVEHDVLSERGGCGGEGGG